MRRRVRHGKRLTPWAGVVGAGYSSASRAEAAVLNRGVRRLKSSL